MPEHAPPTARRHGMLNPTLKSISGAGSQSGSCTAFGILIDYSPSPVPPCGLLYFFSKRLRASPIRSSNTMRSSTFWSTLAT